MYYGQNSQNTECWNRTPWKMLCKDTYHKWIEIQLTYDFAFETMAARGSGRPPSRGREITEEQASKNSQPDRNPHSYGHPILGKGVKNICQSKDSIFNQWCQETWKKNVNKSLSIIL